MVCYKDKRTIEVTAQVNLTLCYKLICFTSVFVTYLGFSLSQSILIKLRYKIDTCEDLEAIQDKDECDAVL